MLKSAKTSGAHSCGVTPGSSFRTGLRSALVSGGLCLLFLAGPALAEPDQLLFGDTHLHSNNSFDAYLNRNYSADPATAYRYAQGYPVIHPYHRARVQIETPLDFLVVSDHAEYLGVMRHIIERGVPDEGLGLVDWVKSLYIEYWLSNVIENDEVKFLDEVKQMRSWKTWVCIILPLK